MIVRAQPQNVVLLPTVLLDVVAADGVIQLEPCLTVELKRVS